MILRTHFEASCTEERIDAMLEQIGQYSDQIDWLIFPDDQPADLGKRLEAREMPGGPGGNWLVRLVRRGKLCFLPRMCYTQPVFRLVLHSSYSVAHI